MSDSFTELNLGSGGDKIASDLDEATGYKHQKALLEILSAGTPTPVSSADPLPTTLDGLGTLSTANSSTTNLAATDQFVGVAEDVNKYAMITVFIYSDVSSAINGARLELSTDGTNWDRAKTFTLEAGKSEVHSLTVVSQYFRVRYTNGSSNQAQFRLQTRYHVTQSKHLTSGIEQVIDKHDDVELYRVVNDPQLDIARSRWSDKKVIHKFGSNTSVGTTEEDIWAAGGLYAWPTAAETLRVRVGGNAADDAAGAGARKIKVFGLDTNFDEIEEEITLAGASASAPTTALFRRVYRAFVTECGAYTGANTGTIIVENTTTGSALCDIAAGIGQTQLSMYTIPNGFKGYLTRLTINVDGSKAANIKLYQRPNADVIAAPFSSKRLISRLDGVTGEYKIDYDSYQEFAAKTDLWMSGEVASGTTAVNVTYDLILVDERL